MYLMLVSFVAWLVSNLAGGSNKLVVTPLIDSFLGSEAVIPVVTTETLLSNLQKIILSWQAINWEVLKWYLPGAGIETLLSIYVFAANNLQNLPMLLVLHLITAAFSFCLQRISNQFTVRCWHFLFAGFACCFISKFLINTSSLLNNFYLSYGLTKEQMMATKAAHILGINVPKMCIYAACVAVNRNYMVYIAIAIAAIPAKLLAQVVLQKIDSKQFKYLVNGSTAVSGAYIFWQP